MSYWRVGWNLTGASGRWRGPHTRALWPGGLARRRPGDAAAAALIARAGVGGGGGDASSDEGRKGGESGLLKPALRAPLADDAQRPLRRGPLAAGVPLPPRALPLGPQSTRLSDRLTPPPNPSARPPRQAPPLPPPRRTGRCVVGWGGSGGRWGGVVFGAGGWGEAGWCARGERSDGRCCGASRSRCGSWISRAASGRT